MDDDIRYYGLMEEVRYYGLWMPTIRQWVKDYQGVILWFPSVHIAQAQLEAMGLKGIEIKEFAGGA